MCLNIIFACLECLTLVLKWNLLILIILKYFYYNSLISNLYFPASKPHLLRLRAVFSFILNQVNGK
jgi:hypothetical protein